MKMAQNYRFFGIIAFFANFRQKINKIEIFILNS